MDEVLAALRLPASSLLNQRVPKKLLLENGAPTAADKRAISEGIEEICWVAALKPSTIGVSVYEDAERQYLEIAVLTMTLRENAKAARLRELVHRAIPYPVVLLMPVDRVVTLSLSEIRHAQNEAGKTVLDGELIAADPTDVLGDLAIEKQPTADLAMLYRSWCNRIRPLVLRAERRAEIEALRREATKEPQLARRVDLNLKVQKLLQEHQPS